MLNVLFFGRIREELDCAQLTVAPGPGCDDLDALQKHLETMHGDRWQTVLGQDNLIRAVNHAVVSANVPLVDGDEVAFFPPVTGG